MFIKGVEFVMKIFFMKKIPSLYGFTSEMYYSKEEIIPILESK